MINVTRSSMPSFEEYCEEIKSLWDSHWLTNMGEKHKTFERNLKAYLNTDNITLYTNGHLALENIIAAFDFPSGAEVITTPFTFASTTHAIARSGLVPVFCDVNNVDYTIDVGKLESLITEKTVAIIPVHVYGNFCDVDGIKAVADKYGLKVIYDAAHAFGCTYKGQSSANFGDAAMFSFHATKVFNTIEGGAICYRDEALSKKLDSLKNFGMVSAEDFKYIGGNAKMNEFQAAMGTCNLRHLDSEIARRKVVAERYRTNLAGTKGIVMCPEQEGVVSNYAYLPMVFDGYKYGRDDVFEKLKESDIVARKYFYPLTNSFECYRNLPTGGAEKTPVAEHIASSVLTLPLYADLEIADVDHICDIILN